MQINISSSFCDNHELHICQRLNLFPNLAYWEGTFCVVTQKLFLNWFDFRDACQKVYYLGCCQKQHCHCQLSRFNLAAIYYAFHNKSPWSCSLLLQLDESHFSANLSFVISIHFNSICKHIYIMCVRGYFRISFWWMLAMRFYSSTHSIDVIYAWNLLTVWWFIQHAFVPESRNLDE